VLRLNCATRQADCNEKNSGDAGHTLNRTVAQVASKETIGSDKCKRRFDARLPVVRHKKE
jgi:hypothetical protein